MESLTQPQHPAFPAGYAAVPLHVASAWQMLAGDTSALPLAPCGYRWEVPLTQVDPDTAHALASWFEAVKQFWRNGGEASAPSVRTVRKVVQYKENVNPGHKSDLGHLFVPLSHIAATAAVVPHITSTHPDWDLVGEAVTASGGHLLRTGHTAHISLPIGFRVPVPAELGGLPTIGQISRNVQLAVNHAQWRTRRARRLTEVSVTVVDAWPYL